MKGFQIQSVDLEQIIDVRHKVLRQGQNRSTCYYPEDNLLLTTHYALKSKQDVIGCASVYKESHPDFSLRQSWRIRGMAVLPEFRNQNMGKDLLQVCINHAIDHSADVIWCNARIKAVPFYKRSGFKIIGDEFDMPEIGPHFLMAKNLGIHSGKKRFFELVGDLLSDNKPIPVTRT